MFFFLELLFFFRYWNLSMTVKFIDASFGTLTSLNRNRPHTLLRFKGKCTQSGGGWTSARALACFRVRVKWSSWLRQGPGPVMLTVQVVTRPTTPCRFWASDWPQWAWHWWWTPWRRRRSGSSARMSDGSSFWDELWGKKSLFRKCCFK